MFQIHRAVASQEEEEEEEEEEDSDDSGLITPDEGPACSVSDTGSTTSLKRKKKNQKLDEALIKFLNRPRQSESLKQTVRHFFTSYNDTNSNLSVC